ncbi:MAG: mercury transporter [Oscillospiraceae bacterium]|jgi:large-conductance mechanosensitive channel|nr:mercury transporter [Oscillospiraceae bacterium]
MSLVTDLSKAVIWLIRAGAAFRVAYCCFRLISNEEEAQSYKARIKNVLVFYIIAECIFQLKDIIIYYFS